MPLLALAMVLVAALTHATWNYRAQRAAASRHIVWLYSVGSALLYAPIMAWILIFDRPHVEAVHWLALLATGVLRMGYSPLLQALRRARSDHAQRGEAAFAFWYASVASRSRPRARYASPISRQPFDCTAGLPVASAIALRAMLSACGGFFALRCT